jgi:hypothetical protein
MNRRILYAVGILLLTIFAGIVGIVYGYAVLGVEHSNNEVTSIASKNLRLLALQVSKLPSSSTQDDLTDLLIEHGDWIASFVSVNEPDCSKATKDSISDALDKWAQAQQKLEELRSHLGAGDGAEQQ